MKLTVTKTEEKEVKTLHVQAGVRYWEDATVNGIEDTEGTLIPCRKGDYWEPIIDLASGRIINWTEGTEADIHYKVCDDGTYTLKGEDGYTVAEKDGYVPEIMCPEGGGFGDYIIMKVDKSGTIANWKVVLDDFEE